MSARRVGDDDDDDSAEGSGDANGGEDPFEEVSQAAMVLEMMLGGDATEVAAKAKELDDEEWGGSRVLFWAMAAPDYPEVSQVAPSVTKEKSKAALALLSDGKSQMNFLMAWEQFVVAKAVEHPDLLKEAPKVLKALYDHDLADEDVILLWADKKGAALSAKRGIPAEGSALIRKRSGPFVEWLKEAEDSDDDEDDDEEE